MPHGVLGLRVNPNRSGVRLCQPNVLLQRWNAVHAIVPLLPVRSGLQGPQASDLLKSKIDGKYTLEHIRTIFD